MPYTSKLIYVTLDSRECMAFFIVYMPSVRRSYTDFMRYVSTK